MFLFKLLNLIEKLSLKCYRRSQIGVGKKSNFYGSGSSFQNVYGSGFSIQYCAARAIFHCPTMSSHCPRSQNTSKEQALIPEKESRRTWPKCHASLEKSSKNHKPLEKWVKPNLSPDVTPQPANFYGEYFWRVCHVVSPDPPVLFAVFSLYSGWPK